MPDVVMIGIRAELRYDDDEKPRWGSKCGWIIVGELLGVHRLLSE